MQGLISKALEKKKQKHEEIETWHCSLQVHVIQVWWSVVCNQQAQTANPILIIYKATDVIVFLPELEQKGCNDYWLEGKFCI